MTHHDAGYDATGQYHGGYVPPEYDHDYADAEKDSMASNGNLPVDCEDDDGDDRAVGDAEGGS